MIAAAFGITLALLVASVGADAEGEGVRPNVILFLVDDMGWMDTTVYGSRYYETPNMERLAESGMRFTSAYTANPLCSPTRASIMTGKYPARLRITTPGGHLPELGHEPGLKNGQPDRKAQNVESRRYLPLEEYTLGEAARDAGCRTCFIGKWHLGKDEKYWPEHQGFEVNIGGTGAPGPPGGYFDPYKNPRLENRREGEYVTDRLTDEAVGYIEKHTDEPFLMCLWHFAVHGPWGHREDITQRYRGREDPRGKQGNPVMASMLFSVDESLGRIVAKLEELGIADRTVLIFTSDNGGNIHSDVEGKPPTNNYPLRGGKATIYEGGTRVPFIVRWPGVVEPGSVCSGVVSSIDLYPTILEIIGGKAKEGQVVDGKSIVSLFKGSDSPDREAIFCHFPHYTPKTGTIPSTWVRKGDWKLIRFYRDGEDFSDRRELYNLKDDISETRDLSKEMPEKVRELDALIDQHLEDIDALVPGANPNYNPEAASDSKEGDSGKGGS